MSRRPSKRRARRRVSPKAKPLLFGLDLATLPFLADKPGGGRNYWSVKPSGGYSKDCTLGKEYARAFIPFLQLNLGTQMLGDITTDMVRAKDTSGVVIGFMNEVARATAFGIVLGAQISGMQATTEQERAEKEARYWHSAPGLDPVAGTLSSDPFAPSFKPQPFKLQARAASFGELEGPLNDLCRMADLAHMPTYSLTEAKAASPELRELIELTYLALEILKSKCNEVKALWYAANEGRARPSAP